MTRTYEPSPHRSYRYRWHIAFVAIVVATLLISGAPGGLPQASAATPDINAWYQWRNQAVVATP